MSFYKTILTTLLISVCSLDLFAQDMEFKQYNYNVNNQYFKLNFSFDIPRNWTISQENDGTGYEVNCTPSNDSEFIKYRDCFEGVIFKVKYLKGNLDSALLTMGLQRKDEGMYLVTFEGKIKIEITTDIKGDTYKGLYYTISNDIICKIDKQHKIAGHYQFIYFSDGIQTICVLTNGKSFDENIFTRIIDSFKFR